MKKIVLNVTEEKLESMCVKQLLQQLVAMNDLLYRNSHNQELVKETAEVEYDVLCEISRKLGV